MALVTEAAGPGCWQLYQPLIVTLAVAADALFDAEDAGTFDPLWPVIDSDAAVAIEFRQAARRRRRWAYEYEAHMSAFRRRLIEGFRALIAAVPDTIRDRDDADHAPFTVPLISLVERPAEVIESLLLCPYDDDTLRYDLFLRLRERISRNMVVASGFPPDTDPVSVQHRLVLPTRHKSSNAVELIDLYLSGTPFAEVMSLPIPFRVPDGSRFEHCHIIGGTGHGKTQLMQRMIHADLVAAKEDGRAVVVIDSQGDLINKLVRLDLFSPDALDSLADRLVLIDPADVEFPPALNLFDAHLSRLREYRAVDQERVLNGVIELYENFFGALLGAELTQKQGVIFRYLARLMITIPGATIHTLMQLMEDGKPFKPHMEALDGSARHFFATEFFHPSFAATKKQILKRLWGMLSTPAFERMFTQRENKLDLFEALNDGKIILINTAKDLLKTEGSQLFGRFFIQLLSQAALERSTLPEADRTPAFVYVDEAQEYFDDTIETILTQGRKYRVSFTAAHQTLDQLAPRLRAAFLSNTSLKCAGGVSNKDARALAGEFHTEPDFIEGMRRKRTETEFAVWLKHHTPHAIQLSVPLGHLERQPTLFEDQYDALLEQNRARYCGTLADARPFDLPVTPATAETAPVDDRPPEPAPAQAPPSESTRPVEPAPLRVLHPVHPPQPAPAQAPPSESEGAGSADPAAPRATSPIRAPMEQRELGKGGKKHRYLQSLVKELAEGQGFRATIEAPLPAGSGQGDVLLERDGVAVAVEVSVTTPATHEQENVRKCLNAGYARVAVVLAKSRATSGRYRAAILETLTAEEQERVSFLSPEDVPEFIASLAPAPAPSESVVRGYRVRVSHTAIAPDEAKERRERLAKLVARSMRDAE